MFNFDLQEEKGIIKKIETMEGIKMTNKKVMNLREVAEFLGISYKTALKLSRRRDFPAVRIGEKRIFVPTSLLEKWIEKRATEPLE